MPMSRVRGFIGLQIETGNIFFISKFAMLFESRQKIISVNVDSERVCGKCLRGVIHDTSLVSITIINLQFGFSMGKVDGHTEFSSTWNSAQEPNSPQDRPLATITFSSEVVQHE